MSGHSAFAKRVRRHVVGRVRPYFAVAAPGFETVVRDEMMKLPLSGKAVEPVAGGVDFEGRLVDCYLANLHLRTAGRVLLRVESFRAVRFDQLETRLAAIPWELYLPADAVPTVSVTAKKSRLHHSEAIGERAMPAIRNRLQSMAGEVEGSEAKAGFPQRVFLRAVGDVFTVSIDSSGDNLYKRGLKTHGGPAPIRETLAAAALMRAGYSGREPLIDPMCGTGAFSLEGAMIAANIPPGMFRPFAFMGWPSFLPRRWEHLKREAAAARRPVQTPRVFASDLNPSACRLLEGTVGENGLSGIVQVVARDFFAFDPSRVVSEKGTVTLNPPYGRRLGTIGESNALFREICRKLRSDYRGWKLALIAPRQDLIRDVPFSGDAVSFQHGGDRRWLLTGRIL